MTSTLQTRLHGEDLFSRLGGEREEEIRKSQIKRNPNLRSLIERYESFLAKRRDYQKDFEKVIESYDQLGVPNVSSKDVEEFLFTLASHQQRDGFNYSGFYLSKLINESDDQEFVIYSHPFDSLDYLGFRNTKKITVNGDIGESVGYQMNGGRIIINGNGIDGGIGDEMNSGEIVLNGNAEGFVGESMLGGTIVVNGNANMVGAMMDGGIILVKGDANDIGGNLINGRVIVDGNAGYRVGAHMENGVIVVRGHAGDEVGYQMRDGRISVMGDVDVGVGYKMNNGKIRVGGNAGDYVGDLMRYGDIYLKGDIGSLGDIKWGNIFHKGKLIVKDGREIR